MEDIRFRYLPIAERGRPPCATAGVREREHRTEHHAKESGWPSYAAQQSC